MQDGTFRPERRPIQPVQSDPSVQDTLNQMSEIRNMASVNENTPVEGATKFTGNIPPQLKNAIQQTSAPTANRGPKKRQNNDQLFVTDNKFQELMAKLNNDGKRYEEIVLPSKGRFYDGENGPKDGKLQVRPMTGNEEEILATPRFVKKGQAVNMIFNHCTNNEFNCENLLTIDRTYLLIYLRGISYTPNYDAEIKCPLCESKFSTTIDLNGLYVDECPDDFDESKLVGTLPNSNFQFKYRLSTGADDQRVQDYRDRRIKDFELSGQADDTLHYRLALMLEHVENITDKHQIQAILRALPIADLNYLRNLVNEPPFGVDTTCNIVCPSCQQDFEIDLPLDVGFFFPKNKKTT